LSRFEKSLTEKENTEEIKAETEKERERERDEILRTLRTYLSIFTA
jgi:hypothetical protein